MEFSCHTWGFNDWLISQALGTIARMGFRYVDLGTGPHLNPARDSSRKGRRRAIDTLQAELDTYNLQVADVYLLLPRISLDDVDKRRADLQAFKAMLPIAKALRAPGITVSPGLVHAEDDAEAQDRTVAALRDMLQLAQDADLALSIEPHVNSMAQTPLQAQHLLEQVSGLQITLDWAQMVYQGVAQEAVLSLLSHTRHVQIRQASAKQLQVPFAEGTLKLAEVVQQLRAASYEGFISIEYLQGNDQKSAHKLDHVLEVLQVRDALRDARDAQQA